MESISIQVERKLNRHKRTDVWVSSVRPKRCAKRSKFFKLLGKHLKFFCDNTSLNCYKYLTEPGRPLGERILWILIHIITTSALAYTISGLYMTYIDTPVMTVVDSDNHPVDNLEFPGVAICDINRVSFKATAIVAQKIIDANVSNKTFAEIRTLLKAFSSIYDLTLNRTDEDKRNEIDLNKLLSEYYQDNNYDITSLMKDLSPTCTNAIVSCYFRNEKRNCSDMFKFRKTQDGYCCTFNYAREDDDIPTDEQYYQEIPLTPFQIKSPGFSNGLSVVLESALDDYYLPILPIDGWKVTIFNANDYPDSNSGAVSECLVPPLTENFLQLGVKSFYSTEAVRSVDVKKRQCMFNDEQTLLQANYTYSDCIVDCRANDIWKLCKCRPFVLPRRGDNEYSQRICNTHDAECLHKNKFKWWSVIPHDLISDEEIANLKAAIGDNDALQCHNCYPACIDASYTLESDFITLEPGYYQSDLMEGIEVKNHSIVHIFFIDFSSVRLKMDIGYYWYELLSNVGGICGVFIGLSLISIVEMVWYFFGFIYDVFFYGKNTIEVENSSGSVDKTRMPTVRGLYWNELLPEATLGLRNRITRLQRRQRY